MTKQKGISLYPGHVPLKEACAYVEKAAHYGFTRAFTCLLSVDNTKALLDEFTQLVKLAKSVGIDVIADVTPQVFDQIGASYNNLQLFADMGAAGVRLDLGFTGSEESLMTFNPYGLQIEINMSQNTHMIETIMDYRPNRCTLTGSHNFFPHRFTGLHRPFFEESTKRFQKYGLTTAAFVKAPSAQIGPWPVSDGLCSMEEHRDKSLVYQAKDLFINFDINTVLISECFASDKELEAMGAIDPNLLYLEVEINPKASKTERSIILDEFHWHRGDEGEYLFRSTQSRVKYKGQEFKAWNTPAQIKKGDVLIESSQYGTYAGELHIARKDMPNSGRTNVVGQISKEELPLIDHIKPWQKFRFTDVSK
ncbi:MAG: DUF871 domain-containing protein [Brevinema sp.]